ncbi:MAG: hypothetical protein O2901_00655 [Verrucomicrobia bacterium]|nr:hypothetical protein [Verrucomicrobiota bacterium]
MLSAPTIEVTPGELPLFWNRRAIFFANLRALFFGNEGETNELVAVIDGIDSYGGRLVPVVDLLFRNGGNLLVLEREPIEALTQYFADVLDLSLPEVVVLSPEDHAALAAGGRPAGGASQSIFEHPAEWIDGFVTDTSLAEIGRRLDRPTVSSLHGSSRGNNKLLLHQHLAARGLTVFDTETASEPGDVPACLSRLRRMGYATAVIKAQIGASGIGMIKVGTADAERVEPAQHLFFAGPAMVQGWLDNTVDNVRVIGSPSVQVFVSEDTVHLYDLTEQILSASSIHEGNMAPPPYISALAPIRATLFEHAGEAAIWLHAQGYRGTASVDFLIVRRGGADEIRVCEINARVTGATYPAILARHYNPGGAWLMRNIRLGEPIRPDALLDALRRHGDLFEPEMPSGVLPINLNLDVEANVAKGQFLGLGATTQQCENALTGLSAALAVAVEFDRD